jgi:carbon monoxide dehydrogenase subunit G
MKLTHEFTVPADVESAWDLLLDLPRVARCMPGAAVDTFDGGSFTGSVKVKLGPMQIVYRGTGRFDQVSAEERTAVVTAQAKESRGSGAAKATITMSLTPAGEHSLVRVVTDLAITGKPAQLGRGLIDEVASRLIATFADNLAREIGGVTTPESTPSESADDVLDVGSLGTAVLLRRGWPVVAGVAVAVVGGVLALALRRRCTRWA